jgi:hypothetical protein
MAKKNPAAAGDVKPPTAAAKKPRGPRGVKLALPAAIQEQLNALPELYPSLKKGLAQDRFLALLSPSLDAAYQSAFDQLVNDLETERTAKVNALRGVTPPVNPETDPNYVAIDDETAQ